MASLDLQLPTILVRILFALAFISTLATATPLEHPNALLARQSADESTDGKKTSNSCSVTANCPSCESVGSEGMVQCCWPQGKGFGSPFDAPGFCICAPPDRWDYALCNGGSWAS